MSKSKVFITGVAGFSEVTWLDSFILKGYHVARVGDNLGGYRDNVFRIVAFYEDDLLNFNLLKV